MSCARMRPSAPASGTASISTTGVTRAAMTPTASSTDIIGPPNAKQSSDSCAICLSTLGGRFRKQLSDRDGGPLDQGGSRVDIVEMNGRQPALDCGVGHDSDHAG